MIADTSVWIEYLRGSTHPETLYLLNMLRQGNGVTLLPVILQETLQGATTQEQSRRWRRLLSEGGRLEAPDPWTTHAHAAEIYRECRSRGVTIRSPNDCVIAASSVALDQPLLHRDADFPRIAMVEPRLKLLPP